MEHGGHTDEDPELDGASAPLPDHVESSPFPSLFLLPSESIY